MASLSFEYQVLKWGYNKNNGPSKWSDIYPAAREGKRQSPVDILSVEVEEEVGEVEVRTVPCPLLNLENTGVSWQLHFHDPTVATLTGGALDNVYQVGVFSRLNLSFLICNQNIPGQVVQIHAHWGGSNGRGSEHQIDGAPCDAEIHIVHYNTKYSSAGEAFDKEDGLAVLGLMVKVGEKEHPELQKICEKLPEVENPFEKTRLETAVDVAAFLPPDRSFFTYPGSLTTPPLYESVTWTLFCQPIEVSQAQLAAMRALKTGSGQKKNYLEDNFRPTCSLKQRKICKYCS